VAKGRINKISYEKLKADGSLKIHAVIKYQYPFFTFKTVPKTFKKINFFNS